ncbi:uncharacterized protein [Narcine bancroftii]
MVLNCSDLSYANPPLVQWRWSDPSDRGKEILLMQILNGNVSVHQGRAEMKLLMLPCIRAGDCTLTFTPRRSDAGFYHCVVWTDARITQTKFCLVYQAASWSNQEDFQKYYIAAGVCGGVLLAAIVIVIAVVKRKAAIQARSSETQMSPLNRERTYMNIRLSDRAFYSNLT